MNEVFLKVRGELDASKNGFNGRVREWMSKIGDRGNCEKDPRLVKESTTDEGNNCGRNRDLTLGSEGQHEETDVVRGTNFINESDGSVISLCQ